MLKHLFDALFYSEEDKIYNKTKKRGYEPSRK